MRKYLLRYLIFWLPAVLASYLLTGGDMTSQVTQWFCGFFLLMGFGVNTGMFAYNYPRNALSFMLAYLGGCTLLIIGLRNSTYNTLGYRIFDHAAGLLTYRPLNMLYQTLLDFSIFQEMWITLILMSCAAAGYLCGLLYRYINPNPYRPRLVRK